MKAVKLSEEEAYTQYDNMLNELYPLDGIACNPFSVLLATGDNCAYELGFIDFVDAENIELIN